MQQSQGKNKNKGFLVRTSVWGWLVSGQSCWLAWSGSLKCWTLDSTQQSLRMWKSLGEGCFIGHGMEAEVRVKLRKHLYHLAGTSARVGGIPYSLCIPRISGSEQVGK